MELDGYSEMGWLSLEFEFDISIIQRLIYIARVDANFLSNNEKRNE